MTYGSVDDVAVEQGRLPDSVTEQESAQWQRWLDRVERAIMARFVREGLPGGLVGQIAAGNVDPAVVADIEVAAVVRKIGNPDGSTSTTVSVDDGSVTRRRDVGEGVGEDPLTLTDAEWALLIPSLPVETSAFSTRPNFVPDRCVW